MKLAVVGPGIMEIPPKGWGAVETVIADYVDAMRRLGWEVLIVNTPRRAEIVEQVNSFGPDFVHIHYDEFAYLANSFTCPHVAVTSHFGYLDQVWGQPRYYRNVHSIIVNTPKLHVFALSPSIASVYLAAGKPPEFVRTLPNGVQTQLFRSVENPQRSDKSICLGKIEPRKKQGFLQSFAADIDFVGNIGDLGGRWPFDSDDPHFLGHWSRAQVHENLGEYGNLVLLSDGEAHPLVVMEALSAGLGVVVSEAAAANLDRSLPFVTVIAPELLTDTKYVAKAIAENRRESISHRDQIREYARTFDWTSAVARFDAAIREIISTPSSPQMPAPKKLKVALLTVATGSYFERFYTTLRESAFKHFCFDAELEIICFTDKSVPPLDRETLIPTPQLEWPFSTLLRYNMFASIKERLDDFDIVVYLDSDMRIEVPISVSNLDVDFFAVEHPGFSKRARRSILPITPSYETDARSHAFVPASDQRTYVQGCVFGGRAKPFLYLATKLSQQIADDLRNAEIPIWHDESYLNRFFADHQFAVLPYEYAFPEGWPLAGSPVITHRDKANHAVRGTGNAVDASDVITAGASPDREMYRQLYLRSHEKTQRLEARLAQLENPAFATLWHARSAMRRLVRHGRGGLSKGKARLHALLKGPR